MQPEVRFTLNAGAVEQLDQILAANNLCFTRLSRETFEVLDKGHPYAIGSESHEKTHGVLTHGTREFPCSLEKYPNRWILCATGEDLQDKWSPELIKILERAFPQPERGILNTPKPERKLDKSRMVSSIGCIAVLVLIVGTIILAIFGAVSAFR